MSDGGSGAETGLKGSEGGDAAYLQTRFRFMVARGPVFGSGPGSPLAREGAAESWLPEQGEIVL